MSCSRASRCDSSNSMNSPRASGPAWRCCARATPPKRWGWATISARRPPSSCCWSATATGARNRKRVPRHATRSRRKAQLCAGIPAMHYYISGKIFRQPGEAKELTKAQREEIATFGRIATRQDDEYSMTHGYALEQLDHTRGEPRRPAHRARRRRRQGSLRPAATDRRAARGRARASSSASCAGCRSPTISNCAPEFGCCRAYRNASRCAPQA